MMEFDDIVVKESPGLCRCCLSEGCYKDLGSEYTWMNDTEIYADMLLECFDISISQHNDGPNGRNRLICEVCITRLRDACNFKKQVLDSEKKFVDMIGRGQFGHKVVIYQSTMKSEAGVEVPPAEEGEVEYLEEEMDFVDDEILNEDESGPEASVSDHITVAALAVKGKRGRPKKTATVVKTERKAKVAKLEEKPRTSKAVSKGLKIKTEIQENYLDRLSSVRRNIRHVLHYGAVLPFHWSTKGFRCFYCEKPMRDCDTLKEHTLKHQPVDLDATIQKIISKDVPVKIDVTNIACKVCREDMPTLEDLLCHITTIHGEEYVNTAGVCVFPFILNRELMQCVLCDNTYDNFMCMLTHMYKVHMTHPFMCQICGLSFINQVRLKRHISNSHIGHKCSICQKVFDAFHKMEKHKQRIHGYVNKTHECNLCTATFENNYQLKVHMGKVHNVEKYRVKCEHCPKITTTKGAMLLHVQSVHSDVKYECEYCDYKTGVKWMIKLHQRKHFGEKNYACSICDRKFGRSSNLRAHMKVHTGNFGRVCRWCRQGFTDLDTLHNHEMEFHYYERYI